jgi:hypothetical protein
MPAGSSTILSSAPARVRVNTRLAGPRGPTTRSSTAAVRARSLARRIVRSPAPSRKVSPRRSNRTCLGRGGRKTPSRASSTRPTPAMSNSPLSDRCEVDPHSTTATRKWPANSTTGSTLSPPPRAATKGGGGEEDPRARATPPPYAARAMPGRTVSSYRPQRAPIPNRSEREGFIGARSGWRRAVVEPIEVLTDVRSRAGRGTSSTTLPRTRPDDRAAGAPPSLLLPMQDESEGDARERCSLSSISAASGRSHRCAKTAPLQGREQRKGAEADPVHHCPKPRSSRY